MNHLHEYVGCEHVIKYCKICNVCYCTLCGKEWGRHNYWYPTIYTTPIPYYPWTCSNNEPSLITIYHAHIE